MTIPEMPQDVHEALFALQAGGPIVLVKDQDGQVGNQKTKYADLIQAQEVIFGRLTPLGLLWVTAPTFRILPESTDKDGPKFVLDWELRHVPSKTSIAGVYPLPAGANPMQNGSAITYARRYALMTVTNAVAEKEDDDGGGYVRGGGMAQRANLRQARPEPTEATAQRAAPSMRMERARPAQQPDVEPPRKAAAARQADENKRYAADGTLLMSKKQLGLLGVLLGKAGVTDRGDKLAIVNDMIQRPTPIESANELTFDEGRGVLDAFSKAIEADAETASVTVIDIYRRVNAPDGGAPGPESVPTAEQAETGHPPAKRASRPASRVATPPRTREQQVTGIPDPNGEPAPWDDEPPAEEWPPVAEPGR